MPKRVTTISLSDKQHKKLKMLAAKQNTSLASLIRDAVEKVYFDIVVTEPKTGVVVLGQEPVPYDEESQRRKQLKDQRRR
mgnify:CR=1 FL=1